MIEMASASRFVSFLGVGGLCALVDVGLMWLLIGLDFHYFFAASLSFGLGLALNFFLHSRLTFGVNYSHQILFRFLVVVLINYFLTLAVVVVFQEILGEPVWGKLVSLPLVAVNGFLWSKHWVFR